MAAELEVRLLDRPTELRGPPPLLIAGQFGLYSRLAGEPFMRELTAKVMLPEVYSYLEMAELRGVYLYFRLTRFRRLLRIRRVTS